MPRANSSDISVNPPNRVAPPPRQLSRGEQPPPRPSNPPNPNPIAPAVRGKLIPPPARRRPPSRSSTDEIPINPAPPEKPQNRAPLPRNLSAKNIVSGSGGLSISPQRSNPLSSSVPPKQPPIKAAPPPKPHVTPKPPIPTPGIQSIPQAMPKKPQSPVKPPGSAETFQRAIPPPRSFNSTSPRTVIQPDNSPGNEVPRVQNIPQQTSIQQQQSPRVPQNPPPRNVISNNSFEKAKPSEKVRAKPNIQPHKISPQRSAHSPERRRAPPPPTAEPSRLNTRNLGANKAVLDSTKGDDSTVKGQIISVEKSFLVMCSSGLDTYANNNQQLTEHDKECLFANLDGIINAHTNVLSKITDSSTASDILLSLVPHLHLYLSYIANMSNAFTTLSSLRERGVFFEVNQKDTLHAQTIEALLERPKQYLESYPATISVRKIYFITWYFLLLPILLGSYGKSGSKL